jgi:ferredoxin
VFIGIRKSCKQIKLKLLTGMILTSTKPHQEILSSLKGSNLIFIIGCGGCASKCKTGDAIAIADMKKVLKENNLEVCGDILISVCCNKLSVEKELLDNEDYKKADTLLILSCGTGAQNIGLRTDKRIIAGLNSNAITNYSINGCFEQFCSVCGNCILSITGGICPKTRCAKGLLNGPCGGFADGKCEANNQNICIWLLIYSKLKKTDKLNDFLKNYIEP